VVNQQGTSRDRLLSAITANRPSVEVYIEFLNEKDPQLMDQVRNSHNYELEHSPENTSVVLEKYIEENLIAFFYDSSLEVHTHEEKQIRQQNIQNYIISA
jgi:hypothetical protein